MYVLEYIFITSFSVCRTPSLVSFLILTALRRFPKIFHWKTHPPHPPSPRLTNHALTSPWSPPAEETKFCSTVVDIHQRHLIP